MTMTMTMASTSTERVAVYMLLDMIFELREALAGHEHTKGHGWQRLRDDLASCVRELVTLCGRVPLVVIHGSWHTDKSRVHEMLQGRRDPGAPEPT